MDQYFLEPTRNTPEICFSPDGKIRIRGRSIHENVDEFYKPSLKWVEQYLLDPADITYIDIQLEYFNSASAKYIIQLLQRFQRVTLKDKKFFINWFYDEGDEDILERGEYFASVLDIDFNFIEIS